MKFKIFPEGEELPKPPAKVKIGIDATSDKLHIGHLVPLRIARHLANEGHQVDLVIGTFTGRIGDPSGQDKTRPVLEQRDVTHNAIEISRQLTILFPEIDVTRPGSGKEGELNPIRVMFNHQWLDHSLSHFMTEMAAHFTVNQLMQREAFRQRESGVRVQELLVPICQAQDSVVLKPEIEIGGEDQLINFQLTRELMGKKGVKPEVCILTPIISGTDGLKMSKSRGNCIFFVEDAVDIFGKVMSISDAVMAEWFPLFTEMPFNPDVHPMMNKESLAWEITRQIKGVGAAMRGQEHFKKVHQAHEIPDKMPTIAGSPSIVKAVAALRETSNTQARKLLQGGAVKVNGVKVMDENHALKTGDILQVGKRHHGRIKTA